MNITAEFFQRDPVTCAREMIGCELVWNGCGGVIVETEAYSVRNDEACHTFTRPSSREFVTRMPAGAAYVYLNYGVHWLLNCLVRVGSEEGFGLLRSLDPPPCIAANATTRSMTTSKNPGPVPWKIPRSMGQSGGRHGGNSLSRHC